MSSISRRLLLGQAVGLVGAIALSAAGAPPPTAPDPNRFVVMSDLHISPELWVRRRADVSGKLELALAQAQALAPRPSAVFVCGDLGGSGADYVALANLLRPAREAGLAVHLALGNHDDRERVQEVLGAPVRLVPDRRAFVVETPRVDWFVLDSLKPGTLAGELGAAQLAWLAQALAVRPGRPAFVLLHHPPEGWPDTTGLEDTPAFLALLASRPRVVALFFGHTHAWSVTRRDGLSMVNVPSVAFSFRADQPTGWLDVRVGRHTAELELHGLDAEQPGVLDRKTIPLRR